MTRPRLIPLLLLRSGGLVKSIRFRDHRYIGDPINAARIFGEFFADELVFLDIDATAAGTHISTEFVRTLSEEITMPFAVGGGIRTLDQIREITRAGAEKVVIGAAAVEDPRFVQMAADEFGSSTIAVCIDVKKPLLTSERVYSRNGRTRSQFRPVEFAEVLESSGAGELIVQSIDRDGTMSGYDLDLIASIADRVTIPVVALGGAGSIDDVIAARQTGHASAMAAGSMFVYQDRERGVLINYPGTKEFLYDK